MALPAEWRDPKVRKALSAMAHPELLAAMVPAAEAQLRSLEPDLARHQAAFEQAFPTQDPVAERYEILLVTLGHAVTSHRDRVKLGQRRLREFTGDATQVLLDKAQLEVWCEAFEAAEAIWRQYLAAMRWRPEASSKYSSAARQVEPSPSSRGDGSPGYRPDASLTPDPSPEHPMLPRFRDPAASMDLIVGAFRARMRWLCRRLAQGKAVR